MRKNQMLSLVTFTALSLSPIALVGCSVDNTDVVTHEASDAITSTKALHSVTLKWDREPVANRYESARFAFYVNKQPATSVKDIEFDPQMPSMGHGTTTKNQKITAVAGSAHEFKIEGVEFIMGGPWVINLTATVNGKRDLVSIPVHVK